MCDSDRMDCDEESPSCSVADSLTPYSGTDSMSPSVSGASSVEAFARLLHSYEVDLFVRSFVPIDSYMIAVAYVYLVRAGVPPEQYSALHLYAAIKFGIQWCEEPADAYTVSMIRMLFGDVYAEDFDGDADAKQRGVMAAKAFRQRRMSEFIRIAMQMRDAMQWNFWADDSDAESIFRLFSPYKLWCLQTPRGEEVFNYLVKIQKLILTSSRPEKHLFRNRPEVRSVYNGNPWLPSRRSATSIVQQPQSASLATRWGSGQEARRPALGRQLNSSHAEHPYDSSNEVPRASLHAHSAQMTGIGRPSITRLQEHGYNAARRGGVVSSATSKTLNSFTTRDERAAFVNNTMRRRSRGGSWAESTGQLVGSDTELNYSSDMAM